MNIKIYNKKGFWSGVFFLVLAVTSIPIIINSPHDMNSARNIKSIIVTIFCVFIGLGQVLRGLDSKCTKEDEQNDDERKRLVDLKTKSSAYTVSLYFCIVLSLLLAITIGVKKSDTLLGVATFNGLIGIFVGVGMITGIMFIAAIGANIYHDKRN